MIHWTESLAKLAALKSAMKTPDKMAMALQGFAATICAEGDKRLEASAGGDGAARPGPTHHLVLLHVRVPPLEDGEVQLVGPLRRRTAVVELHHGRLEDPAQITRSTGFSQRHGATPAGGSTS